MRTMNISLPDDMKEYVDSEVASGRYSSTSEYVRELIREDERRKACARVEEQLREGLRSGEASAMTSEDWHDIRLQVRQRMQAPKPG